MRCVADGALGKEIAGQLSISETTVRRTLREVFDKLGVRNRAQAVYEAHKRHLI